MKIIAADLDRTVIPNGVETDDDSLGQFRFVLQESELDLIYVTARSITSVKRAIQRYNLPLPSAVIGQVGTTLHLRKENEFVPVTEWDETILAMSCGWDRNLLRTELTQLNGLILQDEKEQNQFKLSFTLEDYNQMAVIVPEVEKIVNQISGESAEVTASADLNSGVAYVDILPRSVSKYSALEFYRNQRAISRDMFLCCGDSENDLSMLLSEYPSLLVNNASESVKKIVEKRKVGTPAIVASGRFGRSGNYGSGIVEGLIVHGWVKNELFSQWNRPV